MKAFPLVFCGVGLLAICGARADQIEMQNGDRYMGKVLTMTNSTLVLQSEILGTFVVPRDKVSHILLGSMTPVKVSGELPAGSTSAPKKSAASSQTPAAPAVPAAKDQKQLVQKVQDEFLAGADPAAKSKYNEMVSGFLGGKLNVSDIRAEAKSAADQLRAARKDLGEDAGSALDGYLAILDSFLKETGSTSELPAKNAKPAQNLKPDADE